MGAAMLGSLVATPFLLVSWGVALVVPAAASVVAKIAQFAWCHRVHRAMRGWLLEHMEQHTDAALVE